MELYNYQSLKTLIDGEIREHLDFKIRQEMGMFSDFEEYINQSEVSKSFYENFNQKELTDMYMGQIKEIADSCENLSNKEKVLYLLEIMRLSVMYENIGEKAAILSQAGINAAIMGKGVCASQAKYFRNLLLGCNIESKTLRLHQSGEETEHQTVLIRINDVETTIIDPTHYNGNPDILAIFIKEMKYAYGDLSKLGVKQFVVTEEEIESARKKAIEFVLDYYGIVKLLGDVKFENLLELDKFVFILKVLQNNIVVSQEKEKYRSVVLGNREFEIDKALELLLQCCKLPFYIIYNGAEHDCFYHVTIAEKGYIVSPKNIFKSNSNQIGRKWLAASEEESFSINEDCQKIFDRLDNTYLNNEKIYPDGANIGRTRK